jgi:hypothetical protein
MSRYRLEPVNELRVVAALGSAGFGCAAPAAQQAGLAATPPAAYNASAPAGEAAPSPPAAAPTAFTWTADAGVAGGTRAALRLGEPKLESSPHGNALCFDGVDDGLIFEQNPIAGMSRFTIQVLFRPDASGTLEAPSEQRFVHFEEGSATTPESRRVLIETRVVGDQWFLDTFLRATHGSLALIDPEKKHPVGRWYWVALSYGDGTMRHYIDRRLELEGAVPFEPLGSGRASLGVRLNRVSWFKGCVRELRVTPAVVPAAELAGLE